MRGVAWVPETLEHTFSLGLLYEKELSKSFQLILSLVNYYGREGNVWEQD